MKVWSSSLFALAAACGSGVHANPSPDGVETPAVCAAPDGTAHPFTLASEVNQLILGRWLHCSGPLMVNEGEAGIEFLGDGTYYDLVSDTTGSLSRKSGFASMGTWQTIDISPGLVQVNWDIPPGASDNGDVAFQDNPRKLSMAIYSQSPNAVYALVP